MGSDIDIQKGDKTESIVQAELVRRDIPVSIPVTDNSRYDMVIDWGNNLERVQVKTGRYRDGKVKFNAYSYQPTVTDDKKKSYTPDEIDSFVVYCYDNETTYYLPFEEVKSSSTVALRVEEPKSSHSSINWAEDFELDNRI